MKLKGIIKNLIVIIFDFVLFYCSFGIEVALILISGILFYAWIGGYIALWKDGAIQIDKLDESEYLNLKSVTELLAQQVKEVSGSDIKNIKYYLIPTDVINAYSYDGQKIGITRGALQVSNNMMLNAILSHEVSHSLALDSIFNRIIFANITIVMLLLSFVSIIITLILWCIFLIIGLFQKGSGYFSIFCANGLSKITKEFFQMVQHIVVFIYKTIIGIISRGCEYRADKYACMLGYGSQLAYFLSTYLTPQDERKKTITELIYDSHPSSFKRVAKIREYEKNNQSYSENICLYKG